MTICQKALIVIFLLIDLSSISESRQRPFLELLSPRQNI